MREWKGEGCERGREGGGVVAMASDARKLRPMGMVSANGAMPVVKQVLRDRIKEQDDLRLLHKIVTVKAQLDNRVPSSFGAKHLAVNPTRARKLYEREMEIEKENLNLLRRMRVTTRPVSAGAHTVAPGTVLDRGQIAKVDCVNHEYEERLRRRKAMNAGRPVSAGPRGTKASRDAVARIQAENLRLLARLDNMRPTKEIADTSRSSSASSRPGSAPRRAPGRPQSAPSRRTDTNADRQRRAAFAGNLASRQPMIPEGDERAVYGAAQPRARPDGVGALNLGRLNRPMSARP